GPQAKSQWSTCQGIRTPVRLRPRAKAYNAQIAVDSAGQIIVAAEITQDSNDKRQLVPMLERVAQNMGAKPQVATADTGYFSESQVTDERVCGIELYVAIGKQKHGDGEPHDVPESGDLTEPR